MSVLDYSFPLLFDSAGLLRQEFGKFGHGPGEFERAYARMPLPGDSVLISDLFRFHVIAPNLAVARTIRSTVQLGQIAVVRWPEEVIAQVYDNGRGGISTRDLDFSGDDLRQTDTLETRPGGRTGTDYANMLTQLGTARQEHIWIADVNRYRLVRWDSSGVIVDSLHRKPDWFPGGSTMQFGSATVSPTPRLMDLWEDEQGLLWVLLARPRANARDAWRDHPVKEGVSEMAVAAMPPDYKLWHTVIEVIDPVARRVVARETLDNYVFAKLPQNRIATFLEKDDGIPIITIHQLALQGAYVYVGVPER